jgi:hypothetical protein
MPIKRKEQLKPISREHHHGLLLCWKIRTGIKNGIEVQRIKKYSDWFYKTHLLPHFEIEEKHIFTILGNDQHLIQRAIKDHKHLSLLFESSSISQNNLALIEKELENHIRFEERTLFNEIQSTATADQLKQIQVHHTEGKFIEELNDPFWEK